MDRDSIILSAIGISFLATWLVRSFAKEKKAAEAEAARDEKTANATARAVRDSINKRR